MNRGSVPTPAAQQANGADRAPVPGCARQHIGQPLGGRASCRVGPGGLFNLGRIARLKQF